MKSFILGVAVTALLFVGAAFAFVNTTSAAPAAKATVGPVAMYQLTLDRAFRVTVPLVPIGGTTFVIPSGVGVAITELRVGGPPSNGQSHLTVTTNGVAEIFDVSDSQEGRAGNNGTLRCDPPIILREGDSFIISQDSPYPATSCVIAGYIVYPGEV